MKWLLDTNVVCEPGKRRANSKVVAWLDSPGRAGNTGVPGQSTG